MLRHRASLVFRAMASIRGPRVWRRLTACPLAAVKFHPMSPGNRVKCHRLSRGVSPLLALDVTDSSEMQCAVLRHRAVPVLRRGLALQRSEVGQVAGHPQIVANVRFTVMKKRTKPLLVADEVVTVVVVVGGSLVVNLLLWIGWDRDLPALPLLVLMPMLIAAVLIGGRRAQGDSRGVRRNSRKRPMENDTDLSHIQDRSEPPRC